MSIFSIFHLWAFPWQVYDIRRSQIVASESAPGFLPDPKTAYQGGRYGQRALMDAFNPWDLVKAVGRAFKWAAVGRRRRMEDISYKNSHQSTALEPTRNQFTAFQNPGNDSFDLPPGQRGQNSYLQKPSRYAPLPEQEDSDRLLAHAQSNPTSSAPESYPRPMSRSPARDPALGAKHGDIGTYDPAPIASHHYHHPSYQDPSGHLAPIEYGVTPTAHPETGSLDSQDTSYHSPGRSERRVTPTTLPPDTTPLGPAGRKSSDQAEWDMWAGVRSDRGEDERDLGGGHGVGDNRF